MSNVDPVYITKRLASATLADLATVDCSGLRTGAIAFVADQTTNPLFMYHETSTADVASPTIIGTPNGTGRGRWFRINPPDVG